MQVLIPILVPASVGACKSSNASLCVGFIACNSICPITDYQSVLVPGPMLVPVLATVSVSVLMSESVPVWLLMSVSVLLPITVTATAKG